MVDQIKEESVEVVRSTLKKKPTVCADKWNVAMRESVKDGSKIFGLSNWKDRIAQQLY